MFFVGGQIAVYIFSRFRGKSCTKTPIYAIFDAFLQKNVHMGFEHVLENIMCIIVPHFWGQQLYKNADLCNCWSFFKQTIIHGGPAKTSPIKKLLSTSYPFTAKMKTSFN